MQSHTNVAMQSLEKRVQKILQKLTANPNPFQIASAIHDFDLLTLSIAQNPLLQGPKTAAVMQPLVDRFAEIAREAAPGLEEKDAGPGSTARDPQLAFDICMALGRYSLQRDAKKWENDGLHVADAFAVAANIALKTPALFEDLADGTKLFLKAMHYLGKDMVGFPEGYKPSDCFPQSPVQIQDILPDHRVVFLLDAAATATSSEAGTIMNHWRSLPLPILLTELGRYTLERVYGRRATEGEMIRCLFGIRTEVNLVNLRRAVELSRDDMDGRDIFLGPLACNIAIKNLVPLQSHLAKPWIVDACNAYKESLQRFNDKFKMLGTHQFFATRFTA